MPSYNPPLRDMHFVIHEVLGAVDDLKQIPAYADLDDHQVNPSHLPRPAPRALMRWSPPSERGRSAPSLTPLTLAA